MLQHCANGSCCIHKLQHTTPAAWVSQLQGLYFSRAQPCTSGTSSWWLSSECPADAGRAAAWHSHSASAAGTGITAWTTHVGSLGPQLQRCNTEKTSECLIQAIFVFLWSLSLVIKKYWDDRKLILWSTLVFTDLGSKIMPNTNTREQKQTL